MKKFISAFVAILLLSCTALSASASTLYMDNDALSSSGTDNGTDEARPRNMPTWMHASYLYNGDARRGPSYNSGGDSLNAFYSWRNYSQRVNTMYVYAYLKEATFNDPAADYGDGDPMINHIGYLNQNTAPSGWNYVGVKRGSGFYLTVSVCSSMTSGKYLGADGIRVDY